MELIEMLKEIELFDGLSDAELEKVIAICKPRTYQENEAIVKEGNPGDELFIIETGFVEVSVESKYSPGGNVIVNLGSGQTVGEMSLVDLGRRSATVRALNSPTVVQVISQQDFEALCESNYRIGYIVMRNIATDLSFRLRRSNLSI